MSTHIPVSHLATLLEDFGTCTCVAICSETTTKAMGGTAHAVVQNSSHSMKRLYVWPQELREGDRIIIENKTARIERGER